MAKNLPPTRQLRAQRHHLSWLGANTLEVLATQAGFKTSLLLLGVYDFSGGLQAEGSLPDAETIQKVLVSKLKADRSSGGANIGTKKEWIDKTAVQRIYDVNTTLSRFLLLAAFHDTVEKGNGQLEVGKNGTHPTLTFQAWLDDKYSSVEHVAPQSNKNGWSADLYDDDEFDRLGNLTLLPTNANQSLSDRPWEQKRSLFAALAANTQAESESIIAAMKEQGVDLSKIAGTIYCGKFLPHVHAISGIKETWDLDVVDKRGRELAELAWNRLSPWLNVKDAL